MLSLLRRHQRLIQFGAVGVSGVAVNMAGVWLALLALAGTATAPGLQDAIASAAGIVISILTNFLLNDLWTWGDRSKSSPWLSRLLRYYAVSAAAGGVQFSVAVALSALVGLDIYLAQLAGIVLGTGINYVANNRWTFRSDEK